MVVLLWQQFDKSSLNATKKKCLENNKYGESWKKKKKANDEHWQWASASREGSVSSTPIGSWDIWR